MLHDDVKHPRIIGVDFDGTIVEHRYPDIGVEVPMACETLRELAAGGHKIILWTMRSDASLAEAVAWLGSRDVPLFGINRNPEQDWSSSPKAYCHVYIDDAALGCPLQMSATTDRPRVYWGEVRRMLASIGLLT